MVDVIKYDIMIICTDLKDHGKLSIIKTVLTIVIIINAFNLPARVSHYFHEEQLLFEIIMNIYVLQIHVFPIYNFNTSMDK